MLTALVGGLEATIRIAMPALNKIHLRGFHTTSVAATFGAALITARLEKIGLQRTIQAVGIGGSFASGLLECVPAGSGAKRLHAGWGALCGIVAAQLARRRLHRAEHCLRGQARRLQLVSARRRRSIWT